MCDSSNKNWHDNAWQSGSCIGNGHKSACIIRCDINVIRQEAAEHSADASDPYDNIQTTNAC